MKSFEDTLTEMCLTILAVAIHAIGFYEEDYLQIFKCVFFLLHSFAGSGKIVIPYTGLTTPVGWLSLPQLTVLSRSAIVV